MCAPDGKKGGKVWLTLMMLAHVLISTTSPPCLQPYLYSFHEKHGKKDFDAFHYFQSSLGVIMKNDEYSVMRPTTNSESYMFICYHRYVVYSICRMRDEIQDDTNR